MPTYGYRCTACSHEFERFQKISDPAVTACESCGEAVKKILYPVGIQFKGSGFYVNDYAPKSAKTESASSSTPAASTSETATPSTSAPSTESKPAGTTPAQAPASTTSSSS
ncbi:MAG: FmdB family zinc ribbon protein [Armatimonadota bacterium]